MGSQIKVTENRQQHYTASYKYGFWPWRRQWPVRLFERRGIDLCFPICTGRNKPIIFRIIFSVYYYFYSTLKRLDWLHNIVLADGTIIGVGDPRVPMDQSLFKGDFVKLKSVSLSYTLPASPNTKKIFQNLRLYCTVDNIYTITKYPGWDPEGQGYVTTWDLPQLFSASVGVNIQF